MESPEDLQISELRDTHTNEIRTWSEVQIVIAALRQGTEQEESISLISEIFKSMCG